MPNVTEQSYLPLHWELSLPQHIIEEAEARCERKGVSDFRLYEFSREHMYALTVIAFTAIFNRYIKLVHEDEQLHIFMKSKFNTNDLLLLRRIFESKRYDPDSVLHDMLSTKQATLSIREQSGNDVVETRYLELKSYEGPVDYTELRPVLEAQGITNTKDYVSLVYDVVSVDEHVYTDAKINEIYLPIAGSQGMTYLDPVTYSAELGADLGKLRSLIGDAERHFRKTKYKATPR